MWSAIARIFAKNSSAEGAAGERSEMDGSSISKQAKQRASVKWLLSKAFNNKVPENLKEPFYRDHENQEHLKPQIVGALANAEIYCMALGNIYSDPNYQNLNHWSILQTLARKGVYVTEPSDAQLTETTLIQTNPLKMSAHMAVIESIMVLYAKEVITSDRVLAAVQRFSYGRYPSPPITETPEDGVFLWMSHACEALKKRIEEHSNIDKTRSITNGDRGGGDGEYLKYPELPKINELKDLSDGVGLAALVSFYCHDELPWTNIRISRIPTVQDSLYNLSLVQDFCNRCLPVSIFHITPEDITYMRDSMKTNIVVFLADLFNVIEINPAKCVRYPGMEKINEGIPPCNAHGVVHKRNLLQTVMTPIPDLRSGLDDPSTPTALQVSRSTPTHVPLRKANSLQQSVSEMSEDSLRRGSDESFVVHRGKNIPTLRSVVNDDNNRSKLINNDSRTDDRSDIGAAGKPSNWDETRKSSFAGRRSRRNSMTDDSQLTIENFGGSQDNINFIGRNPDKEVGIHSNRKISTHSYTCENPAIRSSLKDARGSFQLGYDNGCENDENNDMMIDKLKLKRQLSSDDMALKKIINSNNKENLQQPKDVVDNSDYVSRMSFAELNKQKMLNDKGIQLVYMQDDDMKTELITNKSSLLHKSNATNGNTEKKTTFATLPNTTTWQQQITNSQQQQQQQHNDDNNINAISNNENLNINIINPIQLNDVRLKLEEKRRFIECEKRRMEMAMNKQRQKVGKAAFLQAVAKGKGNLLKTPTDTESSTSSTAGSQSQSPSSDSVPTKPPQRPFTLQEITEDASAVERKWLDDNKPFIETRRTPELENMDIEQYQQSIAQMNSSLNDIQSDIQRLTSQQNQMQAVQQQSIIAQQQKQIQVLQQQQIYNSQIFQQQQQQQIRIPEQPQFFLHDQPPSTPPIPPQRRTWAQQTTSSSITNSQDLYQPHSELRTWNNLAQNPKNSNSGFILHDTSSSSSISDRFDNNSQRYLDNTSKYQNGNEKLHHSNSFTLSQQHMQQQQQQQQHSQFGTSHSTPSASPQHRNIHRQISQLLDESKRTPQSINLQQMDTMIINNNNSNKKCNNLIHTPIPAPSVDDMEPQNISFIGNSDDQLTDGLSRLNITSGNRTYRIPSPTRPLITRNSFQPSPPSIERRNCGGSGDNSFNNIIPLAEISSLDKDPTNQKGFYIKFDDEPPKRPKPPLRTKKGINSPRKERSYIDNDNEHREQQERLEKKKQLEKELEEEKLRKDDEYRKQLLIEQERKRLRVQQQQQQQQKLRDLSNEQKVNAASTIIIGNDLNNPDPDIIDERERKKERIMMLSLQRRQEQEEAKARKELEAQTRREREKLKEEERLRKKEEQAARRAAILEQYKLKKAMEEAEREGKVFDKSEIMNSLKPTPRMRPKAASRPRPKTIHIDSGSVEMAEGMLQPSRGKKGSTSNLTANNSTMKRDYYRGSHDSLADRSMSSGLLYRDSPDDSRGMSPCHSANQTLGRRSSYKTSRGSSTDQDSIAYRYGDTDSGLGRATPPRRVPSPGMGSMRHLPSPSGPGSLPGFMSKGRRMFDDGSSDISSTPSSMMEYTGPRLYKQPATKSNRGIMLNAVEYCVFPGVVNREAKKRVLEEINRSESKHFLILFRDAGCQFRALYSYCPDREEVTKLYGTGPRQVNDRMFDKFFKYNSGGKCFSQVHTKHLTVTIDAFTIHNSLWQGKKVHLPNKKDMALVI